MDEGVWFGVRTVYEHSDFARGQDRLYEERIVLIYASSHEGAIEKAEKEAKEYAEGLVNVRFLEYVSGFELFDLPGENAEVYSLMRESRLKPDRYIDKFFDTGRERSNTISTEDA